MSAHGISFEFPEYDVNFEITGDKAIASVPENLYGSDLVDRLYEFLVSMSRTDPYALADIWRSRTWEDLQERFKSWQQFREVVTPR